MVRKFKVFSILFLVMFLVLNLNSSSVFAIDGSSRDFGSRVITDRNKVWTVSFRSEVDMSSLTNNLIVKDITSNTTVATTVTAGNDSCTITIAAPSGGYTVGHTYQLILNSGIKSSEGKSLSKTTVLGFTVVSSGGSSSTSNYTATAKVETSLYIPSYKHITILSTNLPGAVKYKIEGNKNLVNIGTDMYTLVASDTVTVYICDSQGNVMGTSSVDTSATKNSISLQLSF